jgi:hypothetical protein
MTLRCHVRLSEIARLLWSRLQLKKEFPMPQTSPWHSVKENRHHNNTSCTEGNNIEKENRRPGTDGKPLCEHCDRLNKQGK